MGRPSAQRFHGPTPVGLLLARDLVRDGCAFCVRQEAGQFSGSPDQHQPIVQRLRPLFVLQKADEGRDVLPNFRARSIHGSLTGTAIEQEDTLAFSVLESIRPMVETAPLEQAADAYARMMQGKARFRMVLVTKDGTTKDAPLH